MNDKNGNAPAVRKILGHGTTVLLKVKEEGKSALPVNLETLKKECPLLLLNYAEKHNLLDKEGWKSIDCGRAASTPPAFPKILGHITNVVVQVEREDGTETKVILDKFIRECPILVRDYAEKHNLLGEDVWKLLNDELATEKENLRGKTNRKLPKREGAALKPSASESHASGANAETRRSIISERSNAREEQMKVHPIKEEEEEEDADEQPHLVPASSEEGASEVSSSEASALEAPSSEAPSSDSPTSLEEAISGDESHCITEAANEANVRVVATGVASSPNQARGQGHMVVEAPNQARGGGSGDMQLSTGAIQANGSMGGQVHNYHGPHYYNSTINNYYEGDSNVQMTQDKVLEGLEGIGKVLKEILEGIEKANMQIQIGINKLLNERGTDREEN